MAADMNLLDLSGNISRLRHERKMTQEQLADFMGVTKASVSKWETGQSMPDIVMLPRLASFFDVTVDELIGYRPQLTREQRLKLYQEFAEDFAVRPFEEVMAKTREYVKRYYSCYPFLEQICGLWLNHVMLEEDAETRAGVLASILGLCEHILENCKDMGICNEVVCLRAIVNLQLGRAADVVEDLEELSMPHRLHGSGVLAQAYGILGEKEKAESYIQACMYNDVLSLVSNATTYISLKIKDFDVCQETICRIGKVMEAYRLPKLHPNNAAVFEYQAMLCCLEHGEKEKALAHGQQYAACLSELFSGEELLLHGDDYFDRVDPWFEEMNNGPNAPRSRQTVLEDIRKSFDSPLFGLLEGDQVFEELKNKLRRLQ